MPDKDNSFTPYVEKIKTCFRPHRARRKKNKIVVAQENLDNTDTGNRKVPEENQAPKYP
ncbi:MAG: hypothetical protein WD335_04025 [Candidatus Paceibacterota bacterium]